MNLIILPVKNEETTVLDTIKSLQGYELLFIDDNSTDQTFNKVLSCRKKNVKILKNVFDRGKGSALKAGYVYSTFLYALNPDDKVIFLDGDGQIDPTDIKTCLKQMENFNADVAMGNKRHLYSNTAYTPQRAFVSKVYNTIINFLFGLRYEDTQCGLKVFKKSALDSVISKVSVKRFAFDLELVVALRSSGFRVVDSPVKVKKQLNKGSVSFHTIIRTFFDTLVIWVNAKRGMYA